MKRFATLCYILLLAGAASAQQPAVPDLAVRVDPVEFKDLRDAPVPLARIVETRPTELIIALKQFDLDRARKGELVELPEMVIAQSIAGLEARRAELQAEIDAINAMIGPPKP